MSSNETVPKAAKASNGEMRADEEADIAASTPEIDVTFFGHGWFLGLGSHAALLINSTGTSYTITSSPTSSPTPPFSSTPFTSNTQTFPTPLLHLPRRHRPLLHHQTLQDHRQDLRPNGLQLCESYSGIAVYDSPLSSSKPPHHPPTQNFLNLDTTQIGSDLYKHRVAAATNEISSGFYTKVICSRAVPLPSPTIDLLSTLYHGRLHNTPARTFTLSHSGTAATGFSPELVVGVENGKITTEPLAGTRSALGTASEIEARKRDLLSDTKEIAEHAISVLHAMAELRSDGLCVPSEVVVEDFMSVRPRGAVQHLGSRVVGRSIGEGKDAWDAFDALFPAITASGVPKRESLEAIQRLEGGGRARELYSGAVLLLEAAGESGESGGKGSEFFEATLVLRIVFQDEKRAWVQAGAGVIKESKPERELEETREKLASVVPWLVVRDPAEEKAFI
ncbi:hypothetical protein G7Y89_g13829 [Cudoniella acicularis]|uniref:Chorismate-utilising enzyme C-terminal domain-containing protein n=1 Tax=Cudoniella acicularis TaxID=354080 RepID=A0A8H4VW21_9HELO|nr:hypothetical protein G7Y89_g13829 [Cudoniella acicularis]